ncbi:4521_t:CDS:1, partial [Gigaspora rosea]
MNERAKANISKLQHDDTKIRQPPVNVDKKRITLATMHQTSAKK